eukprot:COSAG01_NODE_4183_length_5262_cov_48.589967_1_plen_334_part_00
MRSGTVEPCTCTAVVLVPVGERSAISRSSQESSPAGTFGQKHVRASGCRRTGAQPAVHRTQNDCWRHGFRLKFQCTCLPTGIKIPHCHGPTSHTPHHGYHKLEEEALIIPAGMASVKAMLEEVDGLVTDAKAPVTYRSLSRKLSVSSDIAKRYAPEAAHTRTQLPPNILDCALCRLLAQYARTKGAGVLPLYCVMGRPKCSCNAYSVQLVPGDALDGETPVIPAEGVLRCAAPEPSHPAQLPSITLSKSRRHTSTASSPNCLRTTLACGMLITKVTSRTSARPWVSTILCAIIGALVHHILAHRHSEARTWGCARFILRDLLPVYHWRRLNGW